MPRAPWDRAAPFACLLVGALLGRAPALDVEVSSVVVNLIAEVEVAAQEAGPLIELTVSEGSRVKMGAGVGRLDDRDAALQVQRAEIALRHARQQADSRVKLLQAEETLKLARLELERATSANQDVARVVSDTQVSKLRTELRRAELSVEQATEDRTAAALAVEAAANELAKAQRAAERRQIIAPLDGIVVEVRRRVGEWLEPGQVILRLVRDDRLRAAGFVRLEQLAVPLDDQPATLLVDLGDPSPSQFNGRVTFVSPEANPINRQVRVLAEFENPAGRLRAGLPAQMRIRVVPTNSSR